MMAASTSLLSRSPLERLPLLVLDLVCEYLADIDSKRRSLFAFSLTSKTCCDAAAVQRFRHVYIEYQGWKKLKCDLERWNEILNVKRRVRYVRKVEVANEREPRFSKVIKYKTALTAEKVSEEEAEIGGVRWQTPEITVYPLMLNSWILTEKEREKTDEAWLPLAKFIAQLPGLRDFIYSYPAQIPRCILSALHQYHPNSRLHISSFNFRSLCQEKGRPRDIDPDEFALATSPCLYSVTLGFSPYRASTHVNYNHEAVLQMVATLAPKLRHLDMWNLDVGNAMTMEGFDPMEKPPWQGYFADKRRLPPTPLRAIGALQSLVLYGEFLDDITSWDGYTDFSKLQSLEIGGSIQPEGLQALKKMAENSQFKSLRTLGLDSYSLLDGDRAHMDEATSLLLQNLPPLRDLKLKGFVAEETFSSILNHHRTLRELQFLPARDTVMVVKPYVVSSEHVQRLQKNLPDLQYVTLRIPRTMSDEREVRIYQALGRLRQLKRVSLLLDCSDTHAPYTFGRAAPPPPPAPETFLNAAVDSTLALSIFRTISDANTLSRSTGLPSFQFLQLQVTGYGEFGNDWEIGLETLIEFIARPWVCTRDPREGHETEVTVREVNKEQRIDEMNNYDIPYGSIFDDIDEYTSVWKQIWPTKTGNWREDWSSVPLAEGVE
ncbi:uncharacterized protein GIQ15_01300 [Arthroderma uncinatum]|uniref:uncharacterized protein n=1 Tax=Arthroderma uncinatum TaxID=74035 RepID=UPI00144AB779|nr:uncharacterized protein GIQ15_01300 [Arthroderma uncinatum]KAF3491783.1 hypothetical protein GIQ15_01300 [Arthroderma uncinatum]